MSMDAKKRRHYVSKMFDSHCSLWFQLRRAWCSLKESGCIFIVQQAHTCIFPSKIPLVLFFVLFICPCCLQSKLKPTSFFKHRWALRLGVPMNLQDPWRLCIKMVLKADFIDGQDYVYGICSGELASSSLPAILKRDVCFVVARVSTMEKVSALRKLRGFLHSFYSL